MVVSEKSHEIVNNFCKFIENRSNRVLIEKYSLDELKHAKYQYARDSNREFYKAIEDRIKELEDSKKRKEDKKEKWIDRFVGFVSGVILTLIGVLLKNLLGK